MNDLNPDARRLVDLAREARTPGAEDKLRIARRLAVPGPCGNHCTRDDKNGGQRLAHEPSEVSSIE